MSLITILLIIALLAFAYVFATPTIRQLYDGWHQSRQWRVQQQQCQARIHQLTQLRENMKHHADWASDRDGEYGIRVCVMCYVVAVCLTHTLLTAIMHCSVIDHSDAKKLRAEIQRITGDIVELEEKMHAPLLLKPKR